MSSHARSDVAAIRRLAGHFTHEHPRAYVVLGMALLGVAGVSASQLVMPWIIGRLIDVGLRENRLVLLVTVGFLFAAAVGTAVFSSLKGLAFRRLADTAGVFLRARLVTQLQQLPIATVESRNSRQLNALFIDDVPALTGLVYPVGSEVLAAITQATAAMAIVFAKYGSLMWLALLMLPINAALALWQAPRTRRDAKRHLDKKSQADSVIAELIEAARELKCLANEAWITARLDSAARADLAARLRVHKTKALESVRYSFSWLVIGTVYYVGGLQVLRGELSVGQLVAFVWYIGLLEGPVGRVMKGYSDWQAARMSLERYSALFDAPRETSGRLELTPSAPPSIEYRHVVYRYPETSGPALQGVTLWIAPGQRVAIVGASGAGKTTLAALLVGLYQPQEGAVLLAGRDIRDYTLASVRRYVAVVSQEPFIFDGTIRDNIRVGSPDSTDAAVEEAARVADADLFIRNLPQGYDYHVGTRGGRLSGGQKRRIAIARAVLRDPRILILDEVTGSLDSESDQAILAALERLMHARTTIIISHRLSSIQGADSIVVVDGGAIVAQGSHDRLLVECEQYLMLSRLQALQVA